jgi:ACS family hexuronate transporter-like MFS transporter
MNLPSISRPGSDSLSGSETSTAEQIAHHIGRFRWVICTVLLLGVMKNYMDRQVIGVLKTTLQHDLGWSEIDYGNLVFAFQAAYALGMVLVGRFIDRVGTRLGYALAMAFWSLASMAHGLASSFMGFIVARFALGLGESAVFPASLKAVAEWFPKKERALATGDSLNCSALGLASGFFSARRCWIRVVGAVAVGLSPAAGASFLFGL